MMCVPLHVHTADATYSGCMQTCIYTYTCANSHVHMCEAIYKHTVMHSTQHMCLTQIMTASLWQMSHVVGKNVWRIKNKCTMHNDCTLFWCQSYLNQNELVFLFFSIAHSLHCCMWQGLPDEVSLQGIWQEMDFPCLIKVVVGVSNHFIWSCTKYCSSTQNIDSDAWQCQWSYCDDGLLASWYCTCSS